MKPSSNALGCSGVCLSLWARARPPPMAPTIKRASAPPSNPRGVPVLIPPSPSRARSPVWSLLVRPVVRPLAVGEPRGQDLVDVVAGARVDRRLREDVLPPHDVLVLDLRPASGELRPADAVEVVAGIGAHHRLGEHGHALRRVGPGPGRGQNPD